MTIRISTHVVRCLTRAISVLQFTAAAILVPVNAGVAVLAFVAAGLWWHLMKGAQS